jgi:hypothetical protein
MKLTSSNNFFLELTNPIIFQQTTEYKREIHDKESIFTQQEIVHAYLLME